jgi:hypothetical protein
MVEYFRSVLPNNVGDGTLIVKNSLPNLSTITYGVGLAGGDGENCMSTEHSADSFL